MPKPFALPARARATDNPVMTCSHRPRTTHRREKHPPAIAALSAGSGALASGSPVALAACVVELAAAGSAPVDVRLLPAGSFRASDGSGRPDDVPAWVVLDEDGARMVAEASARRSDRVIDYEHATLLRAKSKGEQAPAAGWYRKLEWRPGDGLYAVGVKWTARAAQLIADLEYRYLSPVISYDGKTGRVQRLLHASLTNDPGLDGLTDLAALAAELFPTQSQEQSMPEILKKLLAALGLSEAASEAEALSAVAALKTNVAALSARLSTDPDPAKYVPIATLSALQTEHASVQGQLAALNAEISSGKVAALVADGLAAGKITPATKDWAEGLGKKDPEALSAFLAAAPVVMKPGETQSGGKKPSGTEVAALSADEQKLCAMLGVAEADYQQTRMAAA
jgi:phage I-like protein